MDVELRYNVRMLGALVNGTTILFGDNHSMVTKNSLPHLTLKKPQSAKNYHHVREAVALGIISIVNCRTKYNLADMVTKSLNGQLHKFLLQNQQFPPVSTAGECKTNSENQSLTITEKTGTTSTNKSTLFLSVISPLDDEIMQALTDTGFCAGLWRIKYD